MDAMHRFPTSFSESLGPWTPAHTLGAGVVALIALAMAATIWPGWPRLLSWLGA